MYNILDTQSIKSYYYYVPDQQFIKLIYPYVLHARPTIIKHINL